MRGSERGWGGRERWVGREGRDGGRDIEGEREMETGRWQGWRWGPEGDGIHQFPDKGLV